MSKVSLWKMIPSKSIPKRFHGSKEHWGKTRVIGKNKFTGNNQTKVFCSTWDISSKYIPLPYNLQLSLTILYESYDNSDLLQLWKNQIMSQIMWEQSYFIYLAQFEIKVTKTCVILFKDLTLIALIKVCDITQHKSLDLLQNIILMKIYGAIEVFPCTKIVLFFYHDINLRL